MKEKVLAIIFFLFSSLAFAEIISGRVVAKEALTPLRGVKVELVDLAVATHSDEEGKFTLETPKAGTFTLRLTAANFYPLLLSVTVPSSFLELSLEPVVSYAERVEVTASRALSRRDPTSFTNVPKERLAESYFGQDPAMLLATTVPGFFAYNDNGHGIGYSYFTIRGFGQARTRVTLNGAPLNDAESGELFFIDLADFLATTGDIQVQRGVFGLSGIGGAVDITTTPAGQTPGFSLHVGGGSYNTQRLMVRYDSGLFNGNWAFTARYSKLTSDGYRDQSWVDMWNYFLSFTRFGERSRLRVNLFGGPEQTHLAYYGIPKAILEGGLTGEEDVDRRFNPLTYPGEIDNFYQPHFQVVHELAWSPNAELSQTFYLFQGDGYYDQFKRNRKLREYNLPDITLPDGTVIRKTDLVRRRTVNEWDAGWTPTLTLTSGSWRWEFAGDFRYHQAHHFGEVTWAQHYPPTLPPNRRYYDYEVRKLSAAARAKVFYELKNNLLLVGGLEFAHHQYDMGKDRLKGLELTDNFDFLLPQAGLLWRLGESSEAYVNIARGMREPAFRSLYDPQDFYGTRALLEPEDVWDWEAGWAFRSERLRGKVNLFFMRFINEIVWAGALDDSGVPIYGNGARSLHRGLEAEVSWSPTPHFGLDGGLTLSRNTFTHYREFGWDGTVASYDGNRIAGYPDKLLNVTARFQLGASRAALSLWAVDRFFLDNTEDNRRSPQLRETPGYVPLVNPGFAVVNLSLKHNFAGVRTLGISDLELEVRANNLLNRRYTAFGYVDGGEPQFIPAAGRNFYFGVTTQF